VTLWANGQLISEGKMPHTVPVAFSSYAGMDVGRDNGLVVDRAYEDRAPCAFTGTVKRWCSTSRPPPTTTSAPCTNTRKSKPSAREPPGEVKEQIEGDRRDRQEHESGGMIRKTGGGR
jgi:hypothetical protein